MLASRAPVGSFVRRHHGHLCGERDVAAQLAASTGRALRRRCGGPVPCFPMRPVPRCAPAVLCENSAALNTSRDDTQRWQPCLLQSSSLLSRRSGMQTLGT